MNKLMVTIALFLSLFSNSANADISDKGDKTLLLAELVEFDINHELYKDVDSGNVTLDLGNNEITLTLSEPFNCPDGQFCPMVMPAPHIITLPIVNAHTDWCGSTIYVAQIDNTPADGLLQIIEVVDYSTLTCKINMPHKTKVTYQTFNPWVSQWTYSTFGATPLSLPLIF